MKWALSQIRSQIMFNMIEMLMLNYLDTLQSAKALREQEEAAQVHMIAPLITHTLCADTS